MNFDLSLKPQVLTVWMFLNGFDLNGFVVWFGSVQITKILNDLVLTLSNHYRLLPLTEHLLSCPKYLRTSLISLHGRSPITIHSYNTKICSHGGCYGGSIDIRQKKLLVSHQDNSAFEICWALYHNCIQIQGFEGLNLYREG